MQIYNCGLDETEIKAFFDGESDTPPVKELLYLEEHPLVRPSFIDEITQEIDSISSTVEDKNLTGELIERFTKIATDFVTFMAKMRSEAEDEAREKAGAEALLVLRKLRDIYLSLRP